MPRGYQGTRTKTDEATSLAEYIWSQATPRISESNAAFELAVGEQIGSVDSRLSPRVAYELGLKARAKYDETEIPAYLNAALGLFFSALENVGKRVYHSTDSSKGMINKIYGYTCGIAHRGEGLGIFLFLPAIPIHLITRRQLHNNAIKRALGSTFDYKILTKEFESAYQELRRFGNECTASGKIEEAEEIFDSLDEIDRSFGRKRSNEPVVQTLKNMKSHFREQNSRIQ